MKPGAGATLCLKGEGEVSQLAVTAHQVFSAFRAISVTLTTAQTGLTVPDLNMEQDLNSVSFPKAGQ